MSTLEESLECIGGYSVHLRNIMIHMEDIMSTLGVMMTLKGHHEYIGG